MSFVGFEISPASTHNSVKKIKGKTQKAVNTELSRKWQKEMRKRNRYFSDFGITTVTFTDADLADMDECFAHVEAILSERPEEELSLDDEIAAIESLDL